MSHDQPSEIDDEIEDDGSSVECRLLIGTPVLAAALFLFDEVGWVVAGKPPEFSPLRWLDRYLAMFASIFLGVLMGLFVVAMLVGLGFMALRLGGAVIQSCRRWRHR